MLFILRSSSRSALSVATFPVPVAAEPPRPPPDGAAVPAEFVPGAAALLPNDPPDVPPAPPAPPPDCDKALAPDRMSAMPLINMSFLKGCPLDVFCCT